MRYPRLAAAAAAVCLLAVRPLPAAGFLCATPHLPAMARGGDGGSGARRPIQMSGRTRGTYNALVLFARFADEAPGDDRKPAWADDLFDPLVEGSFTHFYNEMSRGQLVVAGQVLPKRYVSRSPASAYVAPQPGVFGDYGRFNLEILQQADADVDMGRFDNDGPDGVPNSGDDDGYVDILFINLLTVPRGFFVGGATGLASLGLITDFLSDDPAAGGGVIRVRSRFSGFGGTTQRGHVFTVTAATMCHEFGHVLGLPDLFDQSTVTAAGDIDPAVDSAGIGRWGLMGLGTLGWGIEDGPNAFSAWSLARLGWLGQNNERLMKVDRSQRDLRLQPIDRDGRVLRVSLSEDEYFLIENRQPGDSFYNRNIPAGGLLLWHVDERADNDEERHKQVDLVCADGLFADRGFPGGEPDPILGGDNLDFWARDEAYAEAHNGNKGDATDPFDGVTYTRFAADTNPGARGHAGFARATQIGLALERIRPAGDGVMALDVLLRQPVAGNIGQDTRWSGVVEVDGDVVVEPGVTLTLAPGVEVRFADGDRRGAGFSPGAAELLVYGELAVDGTTSSPATLQAAGSRGWYGVLLLGAGSAGLEQDLATGRLRLAGTELGLARSRLPLGTTRWRGRHRVPWDLLVPAGARLVIEGGAQIDFTPQDLGGRGRHAELAELIVEGELVIDGASSPVRLGVSPPRPENLWYGIRLSGDARVDIDGLMLTQAGFGLEGEVSERARVRVSGSTFHRLLNGLNLTLFGDVTIDDSQFTGHLGPAIRVGGFGLLRLRNTTIDGNEREGVWLSNASLEAISTRIRRNGAVDAADPRSGVFVEGGAGQRIELWDSVVEGNRRHGIDAGGWRGVIELHRTSLRANRGDGIRVDGAERAVFEEVELSGNLGRGADLVATTAEVWTTTVTQNVGGGVRAGDRVRLAVDGSHFTGNSLRLDGTALATVRNSQFSSSGLALATKDATPEIVGNRFRGNTTAIRVEGPAVPRSIRGNTFLDNATAIDNRSGRLLSASGNYWGTADSAAIAGLMAGGVDFDGFLVSEPAVTAVEEQGQAPARWVLHGNWPNPFNGGTVIGITVPLTSPLELSIFDVTGQVVWHATAGVALTAGRYEIAWDGTDLSGRPVASGVYIYEFKSLDERIGAGRMLLLR